MPASKSHNHHKATIGRRRRGVGICSSKSASMVRQPLSVRRLSFMLQVCSQVNILVFEVH